VCEIPSAHGNAELQHFYSNVVGPYWTEERALVETGYRTLEFLSPELKPPAFAMQVDWSLEHLLGYVSSWSATARYIKQLGEDPVPQLRSVLRPQWGEAEQLRAVKWPVSLRAARL
jgi:hypothetical protein